MLVFTEWLKENNLYAKYFENIPQNKIEGVKKGSSESWIGNAFLWSSTPEGHIFWSGANKKWKDEVDKASKAVFFEPMKEKIVTYQDLIKGYILQEGDNIENIHGFTGYQVVNTGRCWYLKNNEGRNGDIYRYLKAEKPNDLGAFPEFETAEALTKEVLRLFMLSPYKIGDSVVIKRISTKTPSPFDVVTDMCLYAGDTARITTIEDVASYDLLNPAYNGDFHKYHLDVAPDYMWSSNLFDRAASTTSKEDQQGLVSPADTKGTIQITITKKRKFNITL